MGCASSSTSMQSSAIAGALADHSDTAKLIPSLGANIVAVLSTNVLLAIGYTIAAVV